MKRITLLAGYAILGLGLAEPAIADDVVLQEFNEPGTASTPTAGGAVRMTSRAQLVRRDDPAQDPNPRVILITDLRTENSAMFDNATGCVKVSLTNNNMAVSTYITCSSRNPGRGFQPATVRTAHEEYQVPVGIDVNGLGFVFYNDDSRGPEVLNIDNVGKVVGIISQVVQIIKNLRPSSPLVSEAAQIVKNSPSVSDFVKNSIPTPMLPSGTNNSGQSRQ